MQSPADGASSIAPPPFLTKTYDMVDDPATDSTVSWSSSDNSFVVWNPLEFARDLLPKCFRHNNFSSFVRQLNTYGFRKVDPDRWEFANDGFIRGQRQRLNSIHRRKPSASPCQVAQKTQNSAIGYVEVGNLALEMEIERLKRDKNMLVLELVRLRQQQQATEGELQGLGQRLQDMEHRQKQIMTLLAKAIQNPGFLARLVHLKENNVLLAVAQKKRRFPKQDLHDGTANGHIVKYKVGVTDPARSALVQFSESDLRTSKLDMSSLPLEGFLQEIEHMTGEQLNGARSVSCNSGTAQVHTASLDVTVKEACRHNSLPSHLPVEFQDLQASENSIASYDLEVAECTRSSLAREHRLETLGLESSTDGGGRISNVDIARSARLDEVTSRIHDGFWEQIFTENLASTDAEAELGLLSLAREQERNYQGAWCTSHSHVDRLAQQIAQLGSDIL